MRYLSEPYWAGYKFGGIYRPLTIFSFSIDYAVWQRWAPGFRLTNLLLHSLNGWLVFLVASTLIGVVTSLFLPQVNGEPMSLVLPANVALARCGAPERERRAAWRGRAITINPDSSWAPLDPGVLSDSFAARTDQSRRPSESARGPDRRVRAIQA